MERVQWNHGLTVLPSERVATSRPFKTTSVDFAGPLYIVTKDSRTETMCTLCSLLVQLYELCVQKWLGT